MHQFTPLSKAKASEITMLRHKKYRDRDGLFVAEGRKCIEELLGNFPLETLVLREGSENPFPSAGQTFYAPSRLMEKMSTLTTPPDCLAVFRMPPKKFKSDMKSEGLVLLLDDIQDPGNLGTIIRTADWFGVRQIFASDGTADAFGPKCVQATMGALGRVKVNYGNLAEIISANPSIPVFGTLLDGEDIRKASLPGNAFVIMGNEGNGISEELRKTVNKGLKIPSYPADSECVESLNVAIATAVVLYEFRRSIQES